MTSNKQDMFTFGTSSKNKTVEYRGADLQIKETMDFESANTESH